MNGGISQAKTMRNDWLQWAAVFPGSRASGRFLYLFIARALSGLLLFVLIHPAAAAERARAKRVMSHTTFNRFSVAFPTMEQNAVGYMPHVCRGEAEVYSEDQEIVTYPSDKHFPIVHN